MGTSANDHYFAILHKPDIGQLEMIRIFGLIREQKGDRSRFVGFAQAGLLSTDHVIRESSAYLLGEIGSSADAPRLVALLFDDEGENVPSTAAEALARIGTAKEFPAMDSAWRPRPKGTTAISMRT
ncbi:MAG TPA: hypothetical protein VM597_28315 [Gemmataceae bacterium]|jgi:hypothetical protein|nr:hypothetical protein [Gemmataceae bacterium]